MSDEPIRVEDEEPEPGPPRFAVLDADHDAASTLRSRGYVIATRTGAAEGLVELTAPAGATRVVHVDDLPLVVAGAPVPQRDQRTGIRVDVNGSGSADPQTEHSWLPVDLLAVALQPPEPPAIAGLVYPGRRHWFTGEPESLKSWCALVLAAAEIKAGRTTVYVDLEMGRREVLERLRALGLTDEQIRDRLVYLEPSEPITGADVLADVHALLADRQPSLVILDAAAGALALHGCDPNSGADVERFFRTVLEPLRSTGAAVVVLDHLVKDREARGRFAIGSERKIGASDVHLRFETVAPFGRGKTGRARIETKKDRPGHLRRPRAADLELASDPATGAITWTFHVPAGEQATPFRPTHLMEKVSIYVERCVDPPSRAAVERGVKGNTDAKRLAIDTLAREGYLVVEEGARGAKLLRSERPYRQADEPTSPTSPDLASTSPEAKSEHLAHLAPSSVGGERAGVVEVDEDATPHLAHPDEAEVERLAALAEQAEHDER